MESSGFIWVSCESRNDQVWNPDLEGTAYDSSESLIQKSVVQKEKSGNSKTTICMGFVDEKCDCIKGSIFSQKMVELHQE